MLNLWLVIKTQLLELSKSDSFKADWYGYASNQLSHILLGFVYTCLFSLFSFVLISEFPHKGVILFFVFTSYVLYEYFSQGIKEPFDTIEDTIYFALYGGGSAVLLFTEVEAGSPKLEVSILSTTPILTIMAIHLLCGVVLRMIEKEKKGGGE